jgi:hypothetical protein
MMLKFGLVAALATGAAAPTLAQTAAPLGYDPPIADAASRTGVVALSAEERTAVLDQAARGKELPINGAPDRGIHGEIGIEVGNHGTRALYGTTIVPLGQTGTAAFSFLTSRSNGWRVR